MQVRLSDYLWASKKDLCPFNPAAQHLTLKLTISNDLKFVAESVEVEVIPVSERICVQVQAER